PRLPAPRPTGPRGRRPSPPGRTPRAERRRGCLSAGRRASTGLARPHDQAGGHRRGDLRIHCRRAGGDAASRQTRQPVALDRAGGGSQPGTRPRRCGESRPAPGLGLGLPGHAAARRMRELRMPGSGSFGEIAVAARPRAADDVTDRLFLAAMGLVAVAYLMLFGYYLGATIIRVPVYDLIGFIMHYADFWLRGDWWGYLWIPHNEHRLVFT